MEKETRTELESGGAVGAGAATGAGSGGQAGQTHRSASTVAPTDQGAVDTQAATGAGQEATIAGAGADVSPQQQQRVDLTQLEEFRQWQSARDRREAELVRQVEGTTARLQEMEERYRAAEEQRLLNEASPDELAAYYQGEAARTRMELERRQAEAAQQQQVNAQATALLQRLGLNPDTPGLDWSGGPTVEGYAQLAASAAEVVAQQVRAVESETVNVAETAAREARQQTLAETGAAQVSTATGPAPSGLQQEYERKLAALKGSGDVAAAARLRREYEKKGLGT